MGADLVAGAALYISSLASARGAETVVFHIASELAARGRPLALLLETSGGRLVERLAQLPNAPVIVDLGALDRPRWLSRACLVAALARELLATPATSLGSDARDLAYAAWKARAPLLGLTRWIRRERPQTVISFLHDPNLTLALATRLGLGETRAIASVRNHVSASTRHAKSRRKRAIAGAMRRAFRHLDRVLAVSQGVREDVLDITGLPPERTELLVNPAYRPDVLEAARAPCPHPWLADGAGPVVVAAGKLKPQKDFATLLRAFARVRTETPARLIVLGEGAERPALEALVRELGIGDRVALPGSVENPHAFFARADLFVLSSAWEGLPNVLIEALACGCPVVSTDCPSGPREILDGSGAGRLVPVGDVAALAAAIGESLEKPSPRERSVACAQRFALGPVVDRYEALLFGSAGPSPAAR